MYKLQLKKWPPVVPKRYVFFSKVFGLSCCIHVVAFCFMFMCMNRHETPITLVLHKRSLPAHFVVLPYIKKIPGALVALQQSCKTVPAIAAPKQVQSLQQQRVPKIAPKQVKKQQQKVVPKKQTIILEKKIEKKIAAPVLAAHKKEDVITHEKKVQEKPQEKKIEKKQEEVIKNSQEHVDCTQQIAPQAVGDQEIIYIGRDDFSALVAYEQIQKHIESVWHPPVGVSTACMCTINVALDDHGTVRDIVIEQSSRVLPYDIAARAALEEAPFPKEMWGKHIIVTFKQ